jgi:hypothetical protein
MVTRGHRHMVGSGLGVAVMAVLLVATMHHAAMALDDGEIQRGRAGEVNDILTNDLPGVARWGRQSCAFHDGAAEVAKARAAGRVTAPDAADTCVAALTRQAHDGALMAFYQDTLERETGSLNGYETLPQRIVAALRDGSNRVDLGGGRLLSVTPGLAFDVGFSRAYWAAAGARQVPADPAKLRSITEACVDQREDRTACFTAGYAQGAAAFNASHRSAAR